MLEAGMKAPEFELEDKDGNTVRLSDYYGRKVVLYFYPRDNTPGCTRQACAFAFRPGQKSDRGIRSLAGKEKLRQSKHGRRTYDFHHR